MSPPLAPVDGAERVASVDILRGVALFGVLEQLFAPDALNALFEKNRNQQYTRKILFVTIVEVMLAVVTRKVDSAHAAMRCAARRQAPP